MNKQYYVYILTNPSYTALYTGITSDLTRRVYEHKGKTIRGFTTKYSTNKLVYYEVFNDAESAIYREKQIKAGSRRNKIKLIEGMNPEWRDLSLEF